MLKQYPRFRVSASVDANFPSILHKKLTFSILHTHFYKTLTSVCLFYTFFYLNNIFLTFFYYFTTTHGPTNFNTHANYIDLYIFLTFFFIISQLPMAPPTLTHTPTIFDLHPLFFSFLFFFSFSFFLRLCFFFFSISSSANAETRS